MDVGVGERMNKLQAQLEADVKKEPKKIKVKPTYQIAEAILSGKDEDDRKEYEARKEARRVKHEQEQAELNRLKEEYQKKKNAEEKARRQDDGKKMEKNKNMVNGKEHGTKAAPLSKKEIEINKRIPPLEVTPSSSEAELREVAVNLMSLLKEVYGDVFDLQLVKKSLDSQYAELEKEMKNESKAPIVFIPIDGNVRQRREEAQNINKTDTYKTSGASKEMIKPGSVKNRLAMFENKGN